MPLVGASGAQEHTRDVFANSGTYEDAVTWLDAHEGVASVAFEGVADAGVGAWLEECEDTDAEPH